MAPNSQCFATVPDFFVKSVAYDADLNLDSDIVLHVVHHNAAAFRICYTAAKFNNSPPLLQQHHESYRSLSREIPDDSYFETIARLKRPFENLMAQLVTRPPSRTLHSYLYPKVFVLEAEVGAEATQLEPRLQGVLPRYEITHPGEYIHSLDLQRHLSPLLGAKVDTYSSSQIQVLERTSHQVTSRVSVNGTEYFFKVWRSGRTHGYHELQAYANIRKAKPRLTNVLICQLHGLVIDEDDIVLQHYELGDDEEDNAGTRLVGLLLSYIEARGNMNAFAPWTDCTEDDRRRWSLQITETVHALHASHIVWGDAKPANVLVSSNGDAVLIDFGGSYTPGWVDEGNKETMEGDWQGVRRISEWLTACSNNPINRLVQRSGGAHG